MPASAPEGEARPVPAPAATGGAAALALTLGATLAAGMTDAVGYLAFGGVFVSFMSGDTTRLGVALAGGPPAEAVLFASVIALFVLGAAAGHVVGVAAGARRRAAVLALCGLLVAMAAAAGWRGMAPAALILVAPAMGALSTSAVRAHGAKLTPTYVTGALVRLGEALADLALGRDGGAVAVLLPLWLCMVGGAVAGAALFARHGLAALGAPAGLLLVLAVLSAVLPAQRPSRSEP